jgi:hypothetical protein
MYFQIIDKKEIEVYVPVQSYSDFQIDTTVFIMGGPF